MNNVKFLRHEPLKVLRRQQRLLPRRKAVTIGVGFLCSDGIVLCADRQLTNTGGFKYEENKIFLHGDNAGDVIFSYAGDPDAAKMIWQDIKPIVRETPKSPTPLIGTETLNTLKKIFRAQPKDLHTLIGIRFRGGSRYLFRTTGKRVVRSVADYIGAGDSSALRYISTFLLPHNPTVREAEVLGSYIVSVANRHIDGCSGGPDTRSLFQNGMMSDSSGGLTTDQENKFIRFEQETGETLRKLLFSA